MERFAAQRPDHSPPETLDDAELATAIRSLKRKLHSVRSSRRSARLAGAVALVVVMGLGFMLAWKGPATFLQRLLGNGTVVTIPELLAWWGLLVGTALVLGIVGYRLYARRLQVAREWGQRTHELERRLAHAEAEAQRRNAPR